MIDQEKIHSQCLSKDPEKRFEAVEQFKSYFSLLSDKAQAWNDLIRLISDEDFEVRFNAASVLGSAFSQALDIEKQKVWSNLHRLTNDESLNVRSSAAEVLGSIFSHIPDEYKQQTWNDLHRLTNDKDYDIRSSAAEALGFAFSHIPDEYKQKAWNDLHRLTDDEHWSARFWAASALRSAFSDVPDKQQAWNDLHRLTNDEESDVRYSAAEALGSAFSQVPDKQQAWNDLIRLTNDEESDVRFNAVCVLVCAISQVPDKQQAWDDLIKLTNDKESDVRSRAASLLFFAFSQAPDKQKAWNDLIRLINDEDRDVRFNAAESLGSAFYQVSDTEKQKAWNDLHKLTNDENRNVRFIVAYVLGSAFSQLPDKQQALNDLHRLTNDEESDVRFIVAYVLGSVFSQLSDKKQAWNDLHKLTNDKHSLVKSGVAEALCSSFSQLPDKQQAWNDLHRLTNDEDSDVRSYSNHSLGSVSIFMASRVEKDEDYKKELEKAIEFFEIATKEASHYNPAQFCLPFYRSFYTIIYKKQEAKEEVDKYLEEAKGAIHGSKSKELLFEAVNNLANALKEVQNLENLDLEAKKCELNFYKKYCDRAAELMRDTEETAPFATMTMRKGLPIFDRNLKGLIEEIQRNAKIACKESIGTATEEIARAVNREVQKWEIGSQEYLEIQIESLVFLLRSYIPKTEENNLILNRIDKILQESDIVKQYTLLNNLIPQIIDIQRNGSVLREIQDLMDSVYILIESIDKLQDQQEYIDIIKRNLEEIKNDMPEMKGKIDEVLYELYSPASMDQKLKIAIPIIPTLVSYELETNVPKLVADKIYELKNLVLRFKKGK